MKVHTAGAGSFLQRVHLYHKQNFHSGLILRCGCPKQMSALAPGIIAICKQTLPFLYPKGQHKVIPLLSPWYLPALNAPQTVCNCISHALFN